MDPKFVHSTWAQWHTVVRGLRNACRSTATLEEKEGDFYKMARIV